MHPVKSCCSSPVISPLANSEKKGEHFPLVKPRPLRLGDTIGIFTPSWPAHARLREKYLHGISELKRLGFQVLEGKLTTKNSFQGYRSGTPKERAEEFMDLIRNPEVKCLMSTIGGWNTSSMIPFLDFEEIRRQRKIICGYSDVTSLHLAILKYSHLSTFYGPALVPVFGEYPSAFRDTYEGFYKISSQRQLGRLKLTPPEYWSNHFIDAAKEHWKKEERKYQKNDGWRVLSPGQVVKSRALIMNLETGVSIAGTEFFPDVSHHILVIEETDAPFSKMERNYRHLELMGIFEKVSGLILSKPGEVDSEGYPGERDDLLREIIGQRPYPIITNFDCGHTFPMITLPQKSTLSIYANEFPPSIFIEESAVED